MLMLTAVDPIRDPASQSVGWFISRMDVATAVSYANRKALEANFRHQRPRRNVFKMYLFLERTYSRQ